MSEYDRTFWEERWAEALRRHAGLRPPNAHLAAETADLAPGRALDAGCGHGSDALWLSTRGWRVTGVDFAATALAHARSADVDHRVEWIEGDLGTWTPEPRAYDLVVSLYVHVAGSVEDAVRRLAGGVAPGGTLLLAGDTSAVGQVQVSVDRALAALAPAEWEIVVAEERPRQRGGSDAVIRARRR